MDRQHKTKKPPNMFVECKTKYLRTWAGVGWMGDSHDGAGVVARLQHHARGHKPEGCQPVKGRRGQVLA